MTFQICIRDDICMPKSTIVEYKDDWGKREKLMIFIEEQQMQNEGNTRSNSTRKKGKVTHLAVLKKEYIEEILVGTKKIESRFMRIKRLPFGRVSDGDKLFFKISSGPVCAKGEIRKVEYIENLTPKKIKNIRNKYGKCIGGSEDYWRGNGEAKFGVLIWLGNVQRMKIKYIDKSDRQAWVILKEGNGYGLL